MHFIFFGPSSADAADRVREALTHVRDTANFNWADGHATSERYAYLKRENEFAANLKAGNIGPSDKDTYYSPMQEGKGVGDNVP